MCSSAARAYQGVHNATCEHACSKQSAKRRGAVVRGRALRMAIASPRLHLETHLVAEANALEYVSRASRSDVVHHARSQVLCSGLHRKGDSVADVGLAAAAQKIAIEPRQGARGSAEKVDKVAGAVDDRGADGRKGVDNLRVGTEILPLVFLAHLVPLENLPA